MDLMLAQTLAHTLGALPVVANADHAPLEGGEDPAFGTVRWRTLFDAERNGTNDMVLGVAEFGPYGTLKAHRHSPSEIYFGLSGSGTVTIDGIAHDLTPHTALYIPSEAEHHTVANGEGLKFLYVFPRGAFSEVDYRFSPD
ncbi:cupin domain-containing protein [Primorskyibacter sp. 2E107]|uniref:cupin domain-containing protein n=1 Tax=Primorskyibacter sp. 2E107 TaxID=3403458 RepID=UPI003AF5D73C